MSAWSHPESSPPREEAGGGGAGSPPPARSRRVLIVDDHPLVRAGLTDLLEGESDLEVCGEAESVRPARRLIGETRPDLVLLDLSLKDGDGTELIQEMARRRPALKILVFSMHDEEAYAEAVVAEGARGYVGKGEPAEKVLEAIRCVLAGGVYFSERMRDLIRRRGRSR